MTFKGFVRITLLLATAQLGTGALAMQSPTGLRMKPANAVFNVPDQEFTQITSVRELSSGQLLVADRRENRLALIDWASGRATPIGRVGNGPGEYNGIGWLFALGGDSTLLTDALSRRWYIMAGSDIVETLPAAGPLNFVLGPGLSGTDDSGRVLGSTAFHYPTWIRLGREFADSLFLILADRRTIRLDTIGRVAGKGRLGVTHSRVVGLTANPLVTEDLAVLFRDGWIALAWAEPYRVDWRTPAGTWIRGAALPFAPEPVTEREKCAALRRWTPEVPGRACNASAIAVWPRRMPPYLSYSTTLLNGYATAALLAMPDGRLLIRRAPSLRRPGTVYDVVDRRGRLAATLALSANEAIIGFGAGSVFVIVTDEYGLQTLRRHPWP